MLSLPGPPEGHTADARASWARLPSPFSSPSRAACQQDVAQEERGLSAHIPVQERANSVRAVHFAHEGYGQ